MWAGIEHFRMSNDMFRIPHYQCSKGFFHFVGVCPLVFLRLFGSTQDTHVNRPPRHPQKKKTPAPPTRGSPMCPCARFVPHAPHSRNRETPAPPTRGFLRGQGGPLTGVQELNPFLLSTWSLRKCYTVLLKHNPVPPNEYQRDQAFNTCAIDCV